MKQFKNILVAVDTSLDDHPIISEATKIAKLNEAKLKIVDVVPAFPWNVRLTMKNYEHVRDLMVEEKRNQLEVLAARIQDKDIDFGVKVLNGKASVEITREVLRDNHDLVLRVAKGKEESGRGGGFFGVTGIRLLRECPCAVWLVAPTSTPKYHHVLACVDTFSSDKLDKELNDKVYKLASWASKCHAARLSIIHAWSVYGEKILQNRMNKLEFDDLKKNAKALNARLLSKFLGSHRVEGREANIELVNGDASKAIPEFVNTNGVDLVVMGTVARSGVTGRIIGNTAERVLNAIECSVLAVKPNRFVSPIRMGDYINPSQKSAES